MEEQLDAQAEDIFEINDFTVVTEYERFAVQLEAIIHDWGIQGRRPSNQGNFDKRLKQQSTSVKFKEQEYTLFFYHFDTDDQGEQEEQEEVTGDEDEQRMAYLPVASCEMTRQEFDLRRRDDVFTQYGILEHLLLDPINHTVDNQDLWKDILSVFNVVLLNSGCEVPLFVRFGEEKRNLYNGVVMNRNAQTLFEGIDGTDYLKKLGYFSGLVDLFREKVACEASDQPPIEATVQFDYVYQNNSIQEATDKESNDGELSSDNFTMDLEFGDTKSAVNKICLSVMWPRLNDETVNETDNFSDLDPYTSPRWLVEMKLDGSRKMLFSTMDELLDTKEMPASEGRLIKFASIQQKEPEVASALSMITRSHATDTTDIGFIDGVSRSETLQHFVNSVVRQLYENPFNNEPIANPTDFQSKCLAELQKSKTSPLNSLTLRLSTVLTKCLNSEDGLKKMCTLWLEFVDRLALRWDNSDNIEGIETDSTPDLSTCLLHQKLQMLQFCIETKRKRHAHLNKTKDATQAMCSSSSSSSDIFFDAAEDEQSSKEQQLRIDSDIPKGRLNALEECLVARPDEYIYVPQTQDKGPMTDDMIEQRTQHLVSQSSSDRVKEQLDVLLSDMQAFKAANPGAQIEDFICWHSPRDWSKDEEGKVVLSERMLQPNNIWLDTWQNARPIPVTSQPRLFNETKEAHLILQQFKDMSVRELIDLIQPSAFYSAGYLLVSKAKDAEPLIEDQLPELCKFIARSTRRAFSEDYFDTCKRIESIENKIFWLQSLTEMMNKEVNDGGLAQIVDQQLLRQFNLDIVRQQGPVRLLDAPNGAMAMCIRQLMNQATKFETNQLDEDVESGGDELKLPQPHRKHYIFRWIVPRPGQNSRRMPQRMYACVGDKHFRLAGAFTSDSTFM